MIPQAKAVYSAGVPTWDYARYTLGQDPPQKILQDPGRPVPLALLPLSLLRRPKDPFHICSATWSLSLSTPLFHMNDNNT